MSNLHIENVCRGLKSEETTDIENCFNFKRSLLLKIVSCIVDFTNFSQKFLLCCSLLLIYEGSHCFVDKLFPFETMVPLLDCFFMSTCLLSCELIQIEQFPHANCRPITGFMFHMNNITRQLDSLSEATPPLEWFAQTVFRLVRRSWSMFHLNVSVRQAVSLGRFLLKIFLRQNGNTTNWQEVFIEENFT